MSANFARRKLNELFGGEFERFFFEVRERATCLFLAGFDRCVVVYGLPKAFNCIEKLFLNETFHNGDCNFGFTEGISVD